MYIKVHVVAGARKERVTKTGEARFDIVVKEPAERNLANGRIREILAEQLNVSLSNVRILTGHHSPSKVYTIEIGE